MQQQQFIPSQTPFGYGQQPGQPMYAQQGGFNNGPGYGQQPGGFNQGCSSGSQFLNDKAPQGYGGPQFAQGQNFSQGPQQGYGGPQGYNEGPNQTQQGWNNGPQQGYGGPQGYSGGPGPNQAGWTPQQQNQGGWSGPNQGAPNQGAPNQGAPNQGAPNQGAPNQGGQGSWAPQQNQGGWAPQQNQGGYGGNQFQPSDSAPHGGNSMTPSLPSSFGVINTLPAPDTESIGSKATGFWENTVKSYYQTKRVLLETFGTVKPEVPEDTKQTMKQLQDINRQYSKLAFLSKQLLHNVRALVEAEKLFGEFLYEDGTKETEHIGESMQELGVLHRCWEAPGKNIITSLEQLVDVISTFRSAVVEDALFSLKKTEEARIEWCTMHEGLSKQMNSSNAAEASTAKKIVDDCKAEYDKRRHDLETKVIILNEKRVQELSTQLASLAGAWRNYYHQVNTSLQEEIHIPTDHTAEFRELMRI